MHYCSQQRGHPGIPLSEYTPEQVERAYHAVKRCAPYCTISCVHKVATIDYLRERPREALGRLFPRREGRGPGAGRPLPVRALTWLFLPEKENSRRRVLRRAALRLLGVR